MRVCLPPPRLEGPTSCTGIRTLPAVEKAELGFSWRMGLSVVLKRKKIKRRQGDTVVVWFSRGSDMAPGLRLAAG